MPGQIPLFSGPDNRVDVGSVDEAIFDLNSLAPYRGNRCCIGRRWSNSRQVSQSYSRLFLLILLPQLTVVFCAHRVGVMVVVVLKQSNAELNEPITPHLEFSTRSSRLPHHNLASTPKVTVSVPYYSVSGPGRFLGNSTFVLSMPQVLTTRARQVNRCLHQTLPPRILSNHHRGLPTSAQGGTHAKTPS